MIRQHIKRRLRWEHIRAAGRKRFIVLWGVLGWGVCTALASSVLIIRIEHQSFWSGVGTVAVSLIVFPLCGIFFGYAMWIMCECVYCDLKSRIAERGPGKGGPGKVTSSGKPESRNQRSE
jgi:phosphate/sulfate permease